MAYVMIANKKIKGCTMVKRLILGVCEPKELNKKMDMNKRLYPNDKIQVFKEVKLNFSDKTWK